MVDATGVDAQLDQEKAPSVVLLLLEEEEEDQADQVWLGSVEVEVLASHSDQVEGSALVLDEVHSLHVELPSVVVLVFVTGVLELLHAPHEGSADVVLVVVEVVSQAPQVEASVVASGVV